MWWSEAEPHSVERLVRGKCPARYRTPKEQFRSSSFAPLRLGVFAIKRKDAEAPGRKGPTQVPRARIC